ncbi:MAG TPA: DUF3443 family protein [Anaeromyxobacteraceae bacterium]|nr:DUF3443 family protein [Anaeromyxobacteraceae bacterium]
MRSVSASLLGIALAASACGTGGATSTTVPTGGNVVSITVNGSLCSAASSTDQAYPNKPCVSVTICSPGTSTCQAVSDVLLDTGSYGLRLFKQVLNGVSLPQVSAPGGGTLAECIQYADGSSDWGPIATADVVLGQEPAVRVPVQVIDWQFGSLPSGCTNPDQSPATALFNGILGVGPFAQDCGPGCVTDSQNLWYYACTGTSCSPSMAPLASQVSNPVAFLPQDNNGVIVELPGVPSGGAVSVDGSLVLGIGTQSNNSPSGAIMYPADDYGNMKTQFNDVPYSSYLDTGSNGLFFASPGTATCPDSSSWFCPSPSPASFTATNSGAFGSPTGAVSFQIVNLDATALTNNVFGNIGGPAPTDFDWGLPFFLGRRVFVGIQYTSAGLWTGPYYAY